MKNRVIFVLLLLLLTGFGLFAETLSIDQVRTLALVNSRSLAKYNMSVQSSVLSEKSQVYSMLPSISADYNASISYLNRDWGFENPVDTFNSSANLSVTQILFNGGKSFIQKSISEISTESVRKEALAEYFNVLDSADSAYYAVLEAAATLEAEEVSLETALTSLSIAGIRHESGMIKAGDYLKALADKENRENSRNQARRNLALNITKLKAITGLDVVPQLAQIDFSQYEKLIQSMGNITDEEADSLYDRLRQIFSASNPSLARAMLNTQRAEKNLSLTKRDSSPVVTASIFTTSIGYSTANGFVNSAGGGVAIRGTIPLDFWVMSNNVEKSKIAVNSAALDYISAEIQLETELQSALLNIFAYAGSVLSSRRSMEYSEKHFEYVMELFRLSQSSVSEFGEASSLVITSRNNCIKASYGFLQSLSKLRSLGAIDDEERLIGVLTGA